MRILLLAPVHDEESFIKQKSSLPFVEGQAQLGWVRALKELGHDVCVIRYTDSVLYPNTLRIKIDAVLKRLAPSFKNKYQHVQDKYYFLYPENVAKNIKINGIAIKFKPELILISGGGYGVFPSTIKTLKKIFSCKVILLSGINPSHGSPPAEKKMVHDKIIDLIAVNDKGFKTNWENLGAQKVVVLPVSSVDPKLHTKIKLDTRGKKKLASDVAFVGMLLPERVSILSHLTNFNLKIWGSVPTGTKLPSSLEKSYQGEARGKQMVRIFNASKIVINIHASEMKQGGNMRTFEILGCGAFELTDRVQTEWFKDGYDLVTYKNVKDLRDKISYYLKNPAKRDMIARQGYKTAHSKHTYKKHFESLLHYVD